MYLISSIIIVFYYNCNLVYIWITYCVNVTDYILSRCHRPLSELNYCVRYEIETIVGTQYSCKLRKLIPRGRKGGGWWMGRNRPAYALYLLLKGQDFFQASVCKNKGHLFDDWRFRKWCANYRLLFSRTGTRVGCNPTQLFKSTLIL